MRMGGIEEVITATRPKSRACSPLRKSGSYAEMPAGLTAKPETRRLLQSHFGIASLDALIERAAVTARANLR